MESIEMAKRIFYTFLAVIGIPVNLLGIIILSRRKCGLSTCTRHYLVAMASADLLVVIVVLILNYMNLYYFPVTFLYITPVCSIHIALMGAARDCSVWFHVAFAFDRFVAICCSKLKTKYCTKKVSAVVLATTGILNCLINVPVYFTQQHLFIFQNVPWGCLTRASLFTELGWIVFTWFDRVLNPLIPFGSILLLNALTVSHILITSRIRKGLKRQINAERQSDPEMESRRKSMILLFIISGTFIVLWSVNVIEFVYIKIIGVFSIPLSAHTLQYVGSMLINLSCCTNTFIYGVTQSKFREEIKFVVKYPLKTIGRRQRKLGGSAR